MTKFYVPEKIFFVKGAGEHKEKLTSFELALRDAKIPSNNIVKVSSIYPPECKMIPAEEGIKLLDPGQIIYAVMAEERGDEPHRLLAASIGCARPKDPKIFGYLSEHHGPGQNELQAGAYAEYLAAHMLNSILDGEDQASVTAPKDFSLDLWKELEIIYKSNGKISSTRNITQTKSIGKEGYWTSVVAAAVLILRDPEDYININIDAKFKPLENKVSTLENTVRDLQTRLSILESRISPLEAVYGGIKNFVYTIFPKQ